MLYSRWIIPAPRAEPHVTDKVFWQDPYLDHLRTEVSAIDGDIVRLRATIFYANAGGQESDSGTIAGIAVLKAEKDGLDIAYTLPPGHGLHAGDEVDVRIDWARRYGLMRHHFAAEMVLQLIYDCEPGIPRSARIFHRRRHASTSSARPASANCFQPSNRKPTR